MIRISIDLLSRNIDKINRITDIFKGKAYISSGYFIKVLIIRGA